MGVRGAQGQKRAWVRGIWARSAFPSALAGNSKNVPPQGLCLILGSASSQLESQLSQATRPGRTHPDCLLLWTGPPSTAPSSLGDYELLGQQPEVLALSSSEDQRGQLFSQGQAPQVVGARPSPCRGPASATLHPVIPKQSQLPHHVER